MKPYLLQHLLANSADAYPDHVAVRYEEESITYKELEVKSSRLANLLAQAGCSPRNAVGIYLNKSIEAVIAFFAVLKAGGFYIPLDSAYSPSSRIVGILRISQMQFIITDTRLWANLLADTAAAGQPFPQWPTVIFSDTLLCPQRSAVADGLEKFAAAGPCYTYDDTLSCSMADKIHATSLDMAYVLYTSGSTGVPKGVMLSHLNALTFIDWAQAYFKPQSNDVFANHAPLHFDLSVFDIFAAMACGACINLVPFTIASNPRALIQWMADNAISYWYSVPQVWITILNYAHIQTETLHRLRHILFAGDVFPPGYLKALMHKLPAASYYNLYGPTETNVCTCYHVATAADVSHKPVPIGKACENCEVIVLNERNEPAAIGEEGELFVRGATLTSGYYKDPLRSKYAFIESPLPEHNGDRLYRTGDIVRRCDAQNYEYVGRTDLMVKCAGFRIEITEVERALYEDEHIALAVVVPQVDAEKGQKRLRGFVTLRNNADTSIVQIKKSVAARLPKYMVPDSITVVSEIPTNANGKIDRAKVATWVSAC